jgi:hypothetical protein
LRVVDVSPVGAMTVPVVVVCVLSVTTPVLSIVRWLVVVLDEPGIGAPGMVVDWVEVVLEVEVWAKAPPDIKVKAVNAVSRILVIMSLQGVRLQTNIACMPLSSMWEVRRNPGRIGNYLSE